MQVFFFFLTSFVGEEGGESGLGSSSVVFGPALAAPDVGAVQGDLRSLARPFDLRLSDEAAAFPRRLFFPPAMTVNGDGNIIDEL